MNEWSDFSEDWKQLSPDLTALVERTKRRGRWMQGYFWYQLIGTFIAAPIIGWAFWVSDSPSAYGMLCSAVGFVAGWWGAAWPIWRDLRQAKPPTRPDAILARAKHHIKLGQRLAKLEMLVGICLIVLMGLIWITEPHSQTDKLLILAGAAIAGLWFALSFRYWRRLGREANALLDHSN